MAELRNQRFPFLFERWQPGGTEPAKLFVMPKNPETYRIQHGVRATTTQTKGGVFVDNFGKGVDNILIQGTFGLYGTLAGVRGWRHRSSERADSWTLLKDFEASIFFEFYKQFGTIDKPLGTDKPELRFFNLADEHAFEVLIDRFEITRSIQRPLLYQYVIAMTCLRDLLLPTYTVSQKKTLQMAEPRPPDSALFALWKKIMRGYTFISQTISSVINTMQAIENAIETIAIAVAAFRQGLSDQIKAPFDVVITASRGVDSILESIVSLKELPHEFTEHLRDTQRALNSCTINRHLFQPAEGVWEDAIASTTATEILTVPLPSTDTGVELSGGETPETSLFLPGITQSEVVNSTFATAIDGDTIETLAVRTMGAADQWRRLAFLNGLEPPFIARAPHDGFSPILATGVLVSQNGREIVAEGFIPLPGQTIHLIDESRWAAGIVESYDGYTAPGIITLVEPLNEEFSAGTSVTLHDRQLAVLFPGDSFKVPATSTGNQSPVLGDYTDPYARSLSADEHLDSAGMPSDDASNTVAIAVGLQNLEMQLTHRLTTMRGELAALGHPTYGSLIPTMIGKADTDYWLERIKLEARMTIIEDPRIASVASLVMTVENDVVRIEAQAHIVGSDGTRKLSLLL